MLKKRANYKRLFDDFDARKIAALRRAQEEGATEADAGIIRNRLKVDAVVANAKAYPRRAGGVRLLLIASIWGFVGGKPIRACAAGAARSRPARP